ncbi:hypothetical protein ACO22_03344 [Paracoccidioides brasiliensis]|uniref:Dolichol-phosphate mannosyltransferase n=1 Tax=Paracoccidioides brasiliensis TaxID=121759 RepID=A0A1D2JG62_PARBR|nr:hypothetical protein ACO22_03344 [Paracoccidioides brasiliensis]
MANEFEAGLQPGILHNYTPGLTAFEYVSRLDAGDHKPHSLLFIGGLGDGFFTVPYLSDIFAGLQSGSWSVFSVLLSSSYGGWGMGSLDNDVEEIGKCVDYVKAYKSSKKSDQATAHGPGKIVIMGHSTGSQDVLHYLYSRNPGPQASKPRPAVDGAIMQAPVSDREVILNALQSGNEQGSPEELKRIYDDLVAVAKNQDTVEDRDTLLPLWKLEKMGFHNTAISAKRFLSLASPDSPEAPWEDDLFSSDLTDARLEETFGMVSTRGLLNKSLLVLPGGADEYEAPWLDKEKQLQRWKAAITKGSSNPHIWDPSSGIIAGATHSPSGPAQAPQREELVARVKAFLRNIEMEN